MVNVDQASKRQRAIRLKRQWLLMCSLGEMTGLGAVFAVGAGSVLVLGEPGSMAGRLLALGLVTGAGIIGGSITGHFQSRVLAQVFPAFPRRRFMAATAAVAAIGWAAGLTVPLFVLPGGADVTWPSTASSLIIAAAVGGLLGLAFGGAQAAVMNGAARQSGLWVVGNIVGWSAGMPFTVLFPGLLPDGAPAMAVVVTGAIGGLIAGAWVAVGTAPAVVHWVMLDELTETATLATAEAPGRVATT